MSEEKTDEYATLARIIGEAQAPLQLQAIVAHPDAAQMHPDGVELRVLHMLSKGRLAVSIPK